MLNQSIDEIDTSVVNFGGGGGFVAFGRDLDGDGSADPSIYDPTTGDWFAVQSGGGLFSRPGFGGPGFSPVAAAWDFDSSADPAVYEDATGNWFLDLSATMMVNTVPAFGGPGFVPAREAGN